MSLIILEPQVDCLKADGFIKALSPLGRYFRKVALGNQWLFRGQGKDYPLVPSAFRTNGDFKKLARRDVTRYGVRRVTELDILIDFFRIADKRGLPLPDDSQGLRTLLDTARSERGHRNLKEFHDDGETFDRLLSIFALAQHYGFPTRLLDWTLQPYIAAFFAAESAWRHAKETKTLIDCPHVAAAQEMKNIESPPEVLVVWAFYFPSLGKHDNLGRSSDPIRVITAPSATNPNLRAQQGVFTLLNWRDTGESEGEYEPMDQVLIRLGQKARPAKSDRDRLLVGCKLRKFTLPVSEAGPLLLLLAKLDITPSAIFPGYHRIIDDLLMRSEWPNTT